MLDDIFTEGDSFLALAVLPVQTTIKIQDSFHPHLSSDALDWRMLSSPIMGCLSSFKAMIWDSPGDLLLVSTLRAAEVLLTC